MQRLGAAMSKRSIVFALVAGGFLQAAPATADTYFPSAALQCDGDDLAIRFGGHFNRAPDAFFVLTPDREAKWAGVSHAKGNECVLLGGDKVVLHVGQEPGLPVGAGAQDPPAFISLWINDRKVLSRYEFKAGYAQNVNGPYLNGLFISRGSIDRCVYPAKFWPDVLDNPRPNGVTCSRDTFDLAALQVDPLALFPANPNLIGKYSIASRHSERGGSGNLHTVLSGVSA
jgi:hypothetical protein